MNQGSEKEGTSQTVAPTSAGLLFKAIGGLAAFIVVLCLLSFLRGRDEETEETPSRTAVEVDESLAPSASDPTDDDVPGSGEETSDPEMRRLLEQQ